MNFQRFSMAWRRYIWLRLLRRIHPLNTINWHGKRLRIDLRDYYIGQSLYLYGEYEAEGQRLMKYMNLNGSVCLDIGANLGIYTLAMSDLVGKSGRVLSFEPEKHNFKLLQHNLNTNGTSNVNALQTAMGECEGVGRLAVASHNLGDHQVLREDSSNQPIQEVPITTVDAITQDLSDGVIKFIKIDVQGYETYVIRGMITTLKRNPDAILLIEISPAALKKKGSSVTELLTHFHELGLVGWEFHDYRISPIAEPWVYELLQGGREESFILSHNAERLRDVLSSYYGQALPPIPTPQK
jgi:FkbM family methyltransferase